MMRIKSSPFFWTLAFLSASACGADSAFLEDPAAELVDEAAVWEQHGAAEQVENPRLMDLATGSASSLAALLRAPWPVKLLSIGHTGASYQNYGGSPYFHHGLDLRADAGSEVRAAVGGKVVNIENYVPGSAAYWEIAILDDQGFLWQYHHIERASIPASLFDAWRAGTRIADGTRLGEVFYWGVVSFGERYHHIHVNVLGAGRKYQNPFDFLQKLPDTQAPQFVEVGLLKDGKRWTSATINGNYTVYARVHDLILHARFVVPAQTLSYKLDGGAPVTVWDFSELPGGTSTSAYVNNYFVPALSCGNYTCRMLTVDLGFNRSGTRYFPRTAGMHTVQITARDYAGNETSFTQSWIVR